MKRFSLLLFSTDADFIRPAVAAGIDSIIVDWEYIGKTARQASADTQINQDSVEDLRRVRACTEARVICRLNSYGATTRDEIEQAIGAGTDEVLIPMVRTTEQVQSVLDWVCGRCGTSILVETIEATQIVDELAQFPLARVYVGLNDLAIERKSPNIFTSLIDGTVERLRAPFRVPFGFGGLTLPDRGAPIPCRLLIGEMARLNCSFSFLRRSFHADIRGRDLNVEVPRLLAALEAANLRSPDVVARERQELAAAVLAWDRYGPRAP